MTFGIKMFDKFVYNFLHFVMDYAGKINTWAWRKHVKIIRNKQRISYAKMIRRQKAHEYLEMIKNKR